MGSGGESVAVNNACESDRINTSSGWAEKILVGRMLGQLALIETLDQGRFDDASILSQEPDGSRHSHRGCRAGRVWNPTINSEEEPDEGWTIYRSHFCPDVNAECTDYRA
jgi:hypothetical protein